MKKLSYLIFNLFICQLVAQTNVSGGIFSNTTWTQLNSPYIVTGNIVVFPGVELTIQPGVTVKFNNNTGVEIRQSKLIAIGTISNPIVFTSNNSNPNKGDWSQIYLNLSQNIKIKYCDFQYANAALYGSSDSVFVLKSNFINNISGLEVNSVNYVKVDSCTFRNNNTGQSSNPGYYMCIRNCIYKKNQIGLLAGAACSVANCIIDSNTVYGLYKDMSCNDSIYNNEIRYNGTGIATHPAGGGCGGVIYIYNNIIENNNIGILIQALGGVQLFNLYQNCICSNTMYNFQNQTTLNITATNNSWCSNSSSYIESTIYDAYDDINKGIVTYSPIGSATCQIGLPTGLPDNTLKFTHLYPNPTNNYFSITTNVKGEQNIKLYDLSGKQVLSKNIKNEDTINVENLENGIYTLIIKTSEQVISTKLVVIH